MSTFINKHIRTRYLLGGLFVFFLIAKSQITK